MQNKNKVLFVAYGGGHINMILPVVQALRQSGAWEVEVLALTTAAPVLRRAGIDCIGFGAIADAGDGAALAMGRRLSEGMQSALVTADESAAYMGLSYADLEAEHGVAEAAALYAAQGRHCFLPVRSLGRLLARLQPDLVVATNAPRAERAAIVAARAASIPAICLVDLYPPAGGAWLKDNAYADKVCVLNDQAAQMLVDCGRERRHLAVTGNPAFDRHYLYRRETGAGPFAAGRPVLGFASNILPQPPQGQADGELQRAVFARLRLLCERKGYVLALRQHPNEAPWAQEGAAVNCGAMAIDAYLASLDMLVTFPSTIALEAQIHGVRVGLLDMTSLSQACDYLFNGDFETFQALEQLDALVLERRAAPAGPVSAASSATQRVCAVIQQLMEQGSKYSD